MPRRKNEDPPKEPKKLTVVLGVREDDAHRLLKAFQEGKLKQFGIVDLYPLMENKAEQPQTTWTERESKGKARKPGKPDPPSR